MLIKHYQYSEILIIYLDICYKIELQTTDIWTHCSPKIKEYYSPSHSKEIRTEESE